MKIKGKVWRRKRTEVRPVMVHGAETWAVKTAQEKTWGVAGT